MGGTGRFSWEVRLRSGAVVDSVFTAGPLDPAAATASFDGANVRFTFSIPRGQDGAQGLQGSNGSDGQPGQPGQQGIQGGPGPEGPPFTSFVIDTVTTLQPGEPATVQALFDGASVRLSFGIPQGPQGTNGSNGVDGQTGAPGAPGSPGAPGAPFTSFVVDSVTTLDPGQPATVETSFDGTNIRFAFGIPRGADGAQGIQGAPGPSDLSGTSNNSNSVSALGFMVSDPPTQTELQQVLAKVDELIAALRRV